MSAPDQVSVEDQTRLTFSKVGSGFFKKVGSISGFFLEVDSGFATEVIFKYMRLLHANKDYCIPMKY